MELLFIAAYIICGLISLSRYRKDRKRFYTEESMRLDNLISAENLQKNSGYKDVVPSILAFLLWPLALLATIFGFLWALSLRGKPFDDGEEDNKG